MGQIGKSQIERVHARFKHQDRERKGHSGLMGRKAFSEKNTILKDKLRSDHMQRQK